MNEILKPLTDEELIELFATIGRGWSRAHRLAVFLLGTGNEALFWSVNQLAKDHALIMRDIVLFWSVGSQ